MLWTAAHDLDDAEPNSFDDPARPHAAHGVAAAHHDSRTFDPPRRRVRLREVIEVPSDSDGEDMSAAAVPGVTSIRLCARIAASPSGRSANSACTSRPTACSVISVHPQPAWSLRTRGWWVVADILSLASQESVLLD